MRKKIVFPPKTRKSQMIKRQLKKSERKPWNACPRKKNRTNLLEAAPKRAEEAGVMRLNSLKKKLKVSIPFADRS